MSTFLFHKTRPEGQSFPDGADLAHLDAEGWVDTPAKLSPEHQRATERPDVTQAVARQTPTAIGAGSGRTLGGDPVIVAGTDILGSAAALDRRAQLWDSDGDPQYLKTSDDDLLRTLDDMSREELVSSLGFLGERVQHDEMSMDARMRLASIIRPTANGEKQGNQVTGSVTEVDLGKGDAPPSNLDEAIASAKREPGEVLPPTPTDPKPFEADKGLSDPGDPLANAGEKDRGPAANVHSGDPGMPGEVAGEQSEGEPTPTVAGDQSQQGTDADPGTIDPATQQDTGQPATETFPAGHGFEDWLMNDDTTSTQLRSKLDEWGVAYKARDGKQELRQLLRDNRREE